MRAERKMDKLLLWAYVRADIRDLVEKVAEAMGISLSEYLRQLILADLDRRSLLTEAIKEAMSNGTGRTR